MENGVASTEAQEKAKCLAWFTEIANRAYESILHPADSLERLENEGGGKTDRVDFDLENNFGQRIISCTQHHHNCINLYRKYFCIHDDCVKISDGIAARATKIITDCETRDLTHLALRHITNLLDEIQEWRDKLDLLVDTSLTVPPIKKRTSNIASKTQVEAIHDISEEEIFELHLAFESGRRVSEIDASEGEKFLLLDNTNRMFWTVKNRHGQTGELPSLFLTNCAPDSTLIRKSSRLEDEFAAVIRGIMHLLESSPETLPQIKDLKRQYARLLLSAVETSDVSSGQRSVLGLLELIELPECTAKRNKDARPMPRSPIGSRSQSKESLDSHMKMDAKVIEYTTRITETTVVEDITCYAPEYSEFTGQEVQMFLVAGVIDPRDFTEISIHEARQYGIIDTKTGVYNNLETGEAIPISEAMNQGLIRVEKSVTKKQKEKETKRRARSYENLL